MVDRIVNVLTSWNRLIRAVESLLVDTVASIAPWIAPIIPAYMAWDSMSKRLGFTPPIALAGAVVVEFLGLAAIYTVFQFWDWNDRAGEREQKAPLILALVTAIFYLAVILIVNTMLDDSPLLNRIAKALLSILSAISAVVLALRAQHNRRVVGKEIRDTEAKELRRKTIEQKRQETRSISIQPVSIPPADRLDWRKIPDSEKIIFADLSWQMIRKQYPQLSVRTAQYYKSRAEKMRGGISGRT